MATWTAPASIDTPQQLIDNVAFLRDALDALSGGNVDLSAFLPSFGKSADGKSLTVTSGTTVTTLSLPPGYLFKGAIVNGGTYAPQDIVTYFGTAFSVTTGFTSAGAFANELAANAIVFCSGGILNRGDWNADTTYDIGDAVTYPVGSTYLWLLLRAAPKGTTPPDYSKATPGTSAVWSMLAAGSVPLLATQITDKVQGETQDVINATLIAEFTALNQKITQLVTKATQLANQVVANTDNIASINQTLAAAKVSGFPLTLEKPATS